MGVTSILHLLTRLCVPVQGWFAKGRFLVAPANPGAPTWREHLLLIYTEVPYGLVPRGPVVALCIYKLRL